MIQKLALLRRSVFLANGGGLKNRTALFQRCFRNAFFDQFQFYLLLDTGESQFVDMHHRVGARYEENQAESFTVHTWLIRNAKQAVKQRNNNGCRSIGRVTLELNRNMLYTNYFMKQSVEHCSDTQLLLRSIYGSHYRGVSAGLEFKLLSMV